MVIRKLLNKNKNKQTTTHQKIGDFNFLQMGSQDILQQHEDFTSRGDSEK